jgi:peptide/nickel transport system substrate-binding protein
MRLSRWAAAGAAAALAAGVTACGGGASSGSGGTPAASGGASGTLVVETSFVLKTLDPGRMFETTGLMIDRVLYDTLLPL